MFKSFVGKIIIGQLGNYVPCYYNSCIIQEVWMNEWNFDKVKGRKWTVKVSLLCVKADTLRLTWLSPANYYRFGRNPFIWGVTTVYAWTNSCPSNCFTIWLFERETIVHFCGLSFFSLKWNWMRYRTYHYGWQASRA